jgi:hypothetical protein
MGKPILKKKSDILSASEIGQYRYCSNAWFLQRCGYKPESPFLKVGKHVHVTLGKTIDELDNKLKYSRYYIFIGIFLLCIAFFLIYYGVIL